MRLERVDINEEPFSSSALVIDEDRKKGPKTVALVLFSSGGNIVYLHEPKLDNPLGHLKIMVAAEKFIGETLKSRRYKIFNVSSSAQGVISPDLDLKKGGL